MVSKMTQKYFFGSLKLKLIYARRFESFFTSLTADFRKIKLTLFFSELKVVSVNQHQSQISRACQATITRRESYSKALIFQFLKSETDRNSKKRRLRKLQFVYVKQKFLGAWGEAYMARIDEEKKAYAAKAFYNTVLALKLLRSLRQYCFHHKLEGLQLLCSELLSPR